MYTEQNCQLDSLVRIWLKNSAKMGTCNIFGWFMYVGKIVPIMTKLFKNKTKIRILHIVDQNNYSKIIITLLSFPVFLISESSIKFIIMC